MAAFEHIKLWMESPTHRKSIYCDEGSQYEMAAVIMFRQARSFEVPFNVKMPRIERAPIKGFWVHPVEQWEN